MRSIVKFFFHHDGKKEYVQLTKYLMDPIKFFTFFCANTHEYSLKRISSVPSIYIRGCVSINPINSLTICGFASNRIEKIVKCRREESTFMWLKGIQHKHILPLNFFCLSLVVRSIHVCWQKKRRKNIVKPQIRLSSYIEINIIISFTQEQSWIKGWENLTIFASFYSFVFTFF